jgi:hypothetical protein
MKATATESAPVRSESGRSDPRCPVWPRVVRALTSPAAWWTCLGMLMLNAVIYVTSCVLPSAPLGASAPQAGWLVGWGYAPGMTCNWYLNHGQWRADLRTAVEVARYIFSPDLDFWGSPRQLNAGPFLSATTNGGKNVPHV